MENFVRNSYFYGCACVFITGLAEIWHDFTLVNFGWLILAVFLVGWYAALLLMMAARAICAVVNVCRMLVGRSPVPFPD
jgi:hypothetical protein